MQFSIRRAIAALTEGEDAERHFSLAAERIQRALLEVSFPEVKGIDVGVHAEPSRLVGGDYIDVFVPNADSFVFGLGDASGKSLAAALNALMLRYLVRGLVQALGVERLSKIVEHANEVVTADMAEGSFITFVLGAFDRRTCVLRVVNAGHEPPMLLRAGATRVETMDAHGMVLGIDAKATFPEVSADMKAGDLALIYTDGLTEATNTKGELYTIARLEETLVNHRDLSAKAIADTIFATVKAYAEGELRDDATVLVLRIE